MTRRHHPVSVLQAAADSPTLARLSALLRESQQRLESITPLLPAALRTAVRAGPIDGSEWCLVVDHSAAVAKLRQLEPAICAQLRSHGWEVATIRWRVRKQPGLS